MESETIHLNKLWRTLPTRLRQQLWTRLRLRLATMARRPLPRMKALAAWVLVQKKRRTQADLSVSQPKQDAKTSQLHGKTTQHKPMKLRPPPLPPQYKAILRPLDGLRLDQWTRPALTRAIGVAAGQPPVEVD
ncbi:hypothetical protein HPB50_014853 [Hyalomma asiaticum]|uniref:Uncharacterized protein n=1 Tax=Hyalomma asiaticum TaxID=266040 RepID=A0ACB7RKV4_HYAAI|nr:hypothetical protein HPB50_014853 [Hyalomma asiaticum]